MPKHKKVCLVNLGGFKNLFSIPVFLFNMFNDKNIIPANQPLRALISLFITTMRLYGSFKIYSNKAQSPIYKITQQQSDKLQVKTDNKVEYGFSYSKPYYKKDCSKYIPLYSFYSHTTHGKLLKDAKSVSAPFCVFGEYLDLIEKKIKKAVEDIPNNYSFAIIFSAHSLPKKLIDKTNDTYKHDIEVFTDYFRKRFKFPLFLSFQSKLGPIEWLKPSTEDTIERVSDKYKALILVPISFVSDNLETVYEIDVQYKQKAELCGVKYFKRIDCFNDSDDFINFLSTIL